MQDDVFLLDLNTAIAILSASCAIIGMVTAWVLENRANRKATAMDAVANKLLPFYGLIIEFTTKMNLFMMMYETIKYEDLGIKTQKLYMMAGEAFVYMNDLKSKQLAINLMQILEAIELVKPRVTSESIITSISKTLPLLGLLKNHLEVYLEGYSRALKVSKFDTTQLQESADLHAERTLVEIIQLGSDQEQ